MYGHRLVVLAISFTTAGLLLAACSDDTEPDDTGKKDTGAVTPDMGVDVGVVDQGSAVDQAVTVDLSPDTGTGGDGPLHDQSLMEASAAPDMAAKEAGTAPDQGVTPDTGFKPNGKNCKTSADCPTSVPLCTSAGLCVECIKNTDCATSVSGGLCDKNECTCAADTDCTGAVVWGGKCLSSGTNKYCGCAASTDCAKTSKGTSCDSSYGFCTCSSSTGCKVGTYTVCAQTLSSVSTLKTCSKACKADTDCTKESGSVVCDTTGGSCVGCNKDADCAAYTDKPWSNTCSSKFCLECKTSSDCTAKSLGNKCDTTNNWCTCKSSSDCAGNENGKVCDSNANACSCTKDTDCPTGKKCTRYSPSIPGTKFCM